MNILTFSAESSLYRSRASYRAHPPAGVLTGGVILPQLPIGFCMANCDRIKDDLLTGVCELKCFDDQNGSGGGGGGGGGTCTPGCGPCLPDLESPLGGSKLCVRADCSDYETTCRARIRPTGLGTLI